MALDLRPGPSSLDIDLRAMRIGALLNTSSGSCDEQAQHDLLAALQSVGLTPLKSWCGNGGEMASALQDVRDRELDLLIVLGGDGTIRGAAEQCSSTGPLLMPLPGGTMNMLPKALYGERPWREALRDTLNAPSVQPVHGGLVGERRFFIAALFGGPTRIAEAREALREGDVTEAVAKGVSALQQALTHDLHYQFGDQDGLAETVAVLCPLTSRRLDPDDEVLEAAAIKVEGTIETLRLGLRAAFGDWRNDPNVIRAKLVAIAIRSEQPIPALLDGEAFEVGREARVQFLPHAFRALLPAGDD